MISKSAILLASIESATADSLIKELINGCRNVNRRKLVDVTKVPIITGYEPTAEYGNYIKNVYDLRHTTNNIEQLDGFHSVRDEAVVGLRGYNTSLHYGQSTVVEEQVNNINSQMMEKMELTRVGDVYIHQANAPIGLREGVGEDFTFGLEDAYVEKAKEVQRAWETDVELEVVDEELSKVLDTLGDKMFTDGNGGSDLTTNTEGDFVKAMKAIINPDEQGWITKDMQSEIINKAGNLDASQIEVFEEHFIQYYERIDDAYVALLIFGVVVGALIMLVTEKYCLNADDPRKNVQVSGYGLMLVNSCVLSGVGVTWYLIEWGSELWFLGVIIPSALLFLAALTYVVRKTCRKGNAL